jgi:hypothetical protein
MVWVVSTTAQLQTHLARTPLTYSTRQIHELTAIVMVAEPLVRLQLLSTRWWIPDLAEDEELCTISIMMA